MRFEKGKIVEVPTPLLIAFGVLWLIAACWGIYHEFHKDKDLKDSDTLNQIQVEFENDVKKIQLPPNTAVNFIQPVGKPGYGITVTTRYRTELPQDEFETYFKMNLKLTLKRNLRKSDGLITRQTTFLESEKSGNFVKVSSTQF